MDKMDRAAQVVAVAIVVVAVSGSTVIAIGCARAVAEMVGLI